MKLAFVVVLALHGALHLLGFAKAFGLAQLPKLTVPIDRSVGVLWLIAAIASLAAAALLFGAPEGWWIAGIVALVTSQVAILTAWKDARFGTVPNLALLVALVVAVLDRQPTSFRSIYRRHVEEGLARSAPRDVVTDGDLRGVPAPLQTYLRRVGVVGRAWTKSFRARWSGQMRSSHDTPWMDIRAEQVELFDRPTRLFYVEASRWGVPFEALHVYAGPSATFRVRVASLFDVVDAKGPEMNRSETVTLFNDMCLLAPSSLLSANVRWEEVDERRVRGTFTNAGNEVTAELFFDASGDLVDFVSNDRSQTADGKTYERFPWSTPVSDYRDYGGLRLASRGSAIWREPGGDFAYARFVLESLETNLGAEAPAATGPRLTMVGR